MNINFLLGRCHMQKKKKKKKKKLRTDNIQGTEIEKVTNYKYQGQTIATENSTKEVSIRMECFWKVQRNLPRQAPSYESQKKAL